MRSLAMLAHVEADQMHHGYVLGIGSNIEPEKNVPRIVDELVSEFGRILISRFHETAPVGMKTAELFINFCVFVKTAFEPAACKAACTNIEVKLGRDRTHPCRKTRDRAADIDILARLHVDGSRIQLQETADYLAESAAEIYSLLSPGWPVPVARGHVRTLTVGNLQLGHAPTAIDRDDRTGLIVVG
jgi:2-amino-4-hydroxy-6-hydroxymethyldihydropteridine diphosphokinase